MENAIDALKMSAAILIFIIALGTTFSVLGIAKDTADSIITMQDRQAYLDAAELDNGILYTSTTAIQNSPGGDIHSASIIGGVTQKGDRIVEIADVVSTIHRYSKEKYGVTLIQSDGTVLARFDSNTENLIMHWKNIPDTTQKEYAKKVAENISNDYVTVSWGGKTELEKLYVVYENGSTVGAPWYGNDKEIQKRINADFEETAPFNYCEYNGKVYIGKKLLTSLKGARKIIEVTNEIDKSKYIEDEEGQNTGLLQTYNMPAIEIVYIILN